MRESGASADITRRLICRIVTIEPVERIELIISIQKSASRHYLCLSNERSNESNNGGVLAEASSPMLSCL